MTLTERYYFKFEHLAKYYADKIWSENNIGMEKQDIVQELKEKLFTSIKMYAKKWAEYKKTGRCKPVPMEAYLRSALLNKSRDFIKDINKVKMIPMSQINFDYGREHKEILDAENMEFVIDGFDVLSLFKGQERKMIKFHLKGADKTKIEKIFKNSKLDPTETNKINLKILKDYLLNNNTEVREFSVSYQED
jgi:hypothetical protein